MSSDNYTWVPADSRSDNNIGFRTYKSWAEMCTAEALTATPHQVLLANEYPIDEQYFFEDPEDARWFWTDGYEGRLFLDNEVAPIPYDRMALWIGGEAVATRGYK
jgi:hypothetical protein